MGGFTRNNLPYTPLFCEENIWQLLRLVVEAGVEPDALRVLLISNAERRVALLRQRRGNGPHGLVVWDYHVVLRSLARGGDLIYDYDTTLPFPTASADYLAATFPAEAAVAPPFRAQLREIPGDSYLRRFWSDRSHMAGQVPAEAFPPWTPILATHEPIALHHWWDMGRDTADGSSVAGVGDYRATIC
jgi:hypothetical protein